MLVLEMMNETIDSGIIGQKLSYADVKLSVL